MAANIATLNIVLSKNLTNDIQIFRAWEADKYDFLTLDKMLEDFLNTYGLRETLNSLVCDMSARSVIRSRAAFIALQYFSQKQLLDEFKTIKKHGYSTAQIAKIASAVNLYKKLKAINDTPALRLLTVSQLVCCSACGDMTRALRAVSKAVNAITSNPIQTPGRWIHTIRQRVLGSHLRLSTAEKQAVESYKCLMTEVVPTKKISASPLPLYIGALDLLKKVSTDKAISAILAWRNPRRRISPLLVAHFIMHPEDLGLGPISFAKKYMKGILLDTNALNYSQKIAIMLMSIRDAKVFQYVVNTPLILTMCTATAYCKYAVPEDKIVEYICSLPKTAYWKFKKAELAKLLKTYGLRTAPLPQNTNVFTDFSVNMETVAASVGLQDLQTTQRTLETIIPLYAKNAEESALLDRVNELIKRAIQAVSTLQTAHRSIPKKDKNTRLRKATQKIVDRLLGKDKAVATVTKATRKRHKEPPTPEMA